MVREKFLVNVRNAASLLAPGSLTLAGAGAAQAPRYSKLLEQADSWLAPQAVDGFDPDDFPDLGRQDRQRLTEAVSDFLHIAAQAPEDTPPTREQSEEGGRHLREIIKIVQDVARPEWVQSLQELCLQIGGWARKHGWEIKQDKKTISEGFFGAYEAPRLLLHSPRGRLLLDPVSRFPMGANGLVELCVLPSFDSARITKKNHAWYVEPLESSRASKRLNEHSFVDTIDHLFATA